MLTFAFIALCFILAGTALLFAYLHAKGQFTAAMKSRDRRLARDMKAMRDRFARVDVDLDRMNQTIADVSRVAATGKTQPTVGLVTPFERMQNRVEESIPTMMVNETPVAARGK